MKSIILAALFISISPMSMACLNSIPISEAEKAIALEPGAGSQSCSQKPDEQCLCYDGITWQAAELIDELGPLKMDTVECQDESDCDAKFLALSCSEQGWVKIKNLDLMQAYCVNVSGKKLVNNQQKLEQFQIAQQQKAQINQIISNGAKADADCKRVLHLIGGFKLLPGRSSEQAGEMAATFADAKAKLQDGRPSAAKAAIQAIPVDGVLVTQAMKDLALDILKDW